MMAAREALMIVEESAFGVPVASPVLGTSSTIIRLDGGNAFGMRMVPKRFEIPYGGGVPTIAATGADEYETKGNLKTILYPSQAAMLLGWAGIPINAGQTAPWTTTEPPNDLASCSIYHLYTRSDGSIRRRWYPGVKIGKWGLSLTRKDPVAKISLDLVGTKAEGNPIESTADPLASVFPMPVDSNYPTGPYVFSNSAGGLVLGNAGAIRTQYEELSLSVENALDARAYEAKFVQVSRFLGRKKTELKVKLNLQATPDDRIAFEAVSTAQCNLTLTNGAHSVAFDFKTNNAWSDMDDDFDLATQFMYSLTMMNMRDTSNSADFTITVA